MALTTPRIIGRDLTVTATAGTLTSLTIWNTVKVAFKKTDEDATAADSILDEGVFTTKRAVFTVDGYQGAINNGTTLPAVGDTIAGFATAVGADSTLPDLSAYTNIKVLTVDYDYKKGPATFTFTAQSGMLN